MGNLIADLVGGVGGGSVRDTMAAGPARSGTCVCVDIPLVNHFRQYHAILIELTLEDELTADGFVESPCWRVVGQYSNLEEIDAGWHVSINDHVNQPAPDAASLVTRSHIESFHGR